MRTFAFILAGLILLQTPAFAEKPLEFFETYPAYGFQVFQTPEQWRSNVDSLLLSFSVNSVTGHSALKLTFPKVEGVPGRIVRAATGPTFDGAAGISFWLKGDGSRNYGIVALAQQVDAPKTRIYLRDTNWRRVILSWDKFRPRAAKAPLLSFGLDPNCSRPTFYVIDKVEAIESTSLTAEDAKLAAAANSATFPADPAPPSSYERFIAYPNLLLPAKEALKASRPATILVLGDILARGDKLYNVDTDESAQLLYKYPGVLARFLAEKFAYGAQPAVSETLRSKTGREVVSYGGLRVVSVARDMKAGDAPNLLRTQLEKEHPVLVILQLGSTDNLGSSPEAMSKAVTECVSLAKAAKASVILVTNPPGYGRTAEEEPFAASLRLVARDSHCALVDLRKMLLAGPPNSWSVYFLERYVPNYSGHRLIADIIFSALQ